MQTKVDRVLEQVQAVKNHAKDQSPLQPPPRPMKVVAGIHEGLLDAMDIVHFGVRINELIDDYNMLEAHEHQARIAILKQLEEKIKTIDYKFKPDDIANSKEYRQVRANLLQDIQYQYASMNITMSGKPVNSLSEIIASMPADFANELSELLSASDNAIKGADSKKLANQLNSLCDQHQKLNASQQSLASIKAFREFMKTHSISYLGGNNSNNYLVTHLQTNEKEVLKIENRLQMPKHIEAHLRSKMPEVFTAVGAEQQVVVFDERRGKTGRTLLVTEYCTGGSVLDYQQKLAGLSPADIRKEVGQVFQQMATIMLKIQKAGCFFPDAKISNWLIDKKEVRIADTKSFLFTDAAGIYSAEVPGNENTAYLHTPGFTPPEWDKYEYDDTDDLIKVNANGVHAYILGLNIKHFISKIPGVSLEKIYQGDEGLSLHGLVADLCDPIFEERLSLFEANNKLFIMGNPDCEAVFSALMQLQIGKNDSKMQEYILEQQARIIKAANTPEARKQILTEIQGTIDSLKNNMALNEINTLIANFKTRSQEIFTYGMAVKAAKIEETLSQLPIAERTKFEKSTHPGTEKVMEALAAKRTIYGVKEVARTATNAIDENKASNSFKSFKAKFRAEVAAPPPAVPANAAKNGAVDVADNLRILPR